MWLTTRSVLHECLIGLCMVCASFSVAAQPQEHVEVSETQYWISRMALAAEQTDFDGTYVAVQSGEFFTLHTQHVNVAGQQYELVDKLDGGERQIFRINDIFYAIFPQFQKIVMEHGSIAKMFPRMFNTSHGQPQDYYQIEAAGEERLIGRMATKLYIRPLDDLRFGYTVWVDNLSGLLLRLQVEDSGQQVLEQIAFTEIEFGASEAEKNELPTYIERLIAQDYQIQELQFMHIKPELQGWSLSSDIPGFEAVSSVERFLAVSNRQLVQWVFSDGLVSVSIFIEPASQYTNGEPRSYSRGATNSMSYQHDQWWVTLVGEVPQSTLQRFAQSLHHQNQK